MGVAAAESSTEKLDWRSLVDPRRTMGRLFNAARVGTRILSEGPEIVLDALAALPELASAADGLSRLAESAAVLPDLVGDLEGLVGMVPAIEALGEAAPSLARLSDSAVVLDQLATNLASLSKLPAALERLSPLADAIQELLQAVVVLNSTVSPLQNTAERVGRLVDRLPSKSHRVITATPVRP